MRPSIGSQDKSEETPPAAEEVVRFTTYFAPLDASVGVDKVSLQVMGVITKKW